MSWSASPSPDLLTFTPASTASMAFAPGVATTATYATPSSVTVSYSAETSDLALYAGYAQDACPPVWAQVSSILTEPDQGVDFRLCASRDFPMVACGERYIAAVEVTGGEGNP